MRISHSPSTQGLGARRRGRMRMEEDIGYGISDMGEFS